LPTIATDGSDDGGTIILIGPVPSSLVGAAARRVARVAVFVAFFPLRSETSHRFPSPRPVTPVSSTSYTRWLGVACATDGRTGARGPTPRLSLLQGPPYSRRALITPHGVMPDYCPQKWFPYIGYTSADRSGSDNRQSRAYAFEHQPIIPRFLRNVS